MCILEIRVFYDKIDAVRNLGPMVPGGARRDRSRARAPFPSPKNRQTPLALCFLCAGAFRRSKGATILKNEPPKGDKPPGKEFLRALSFFSQIGITMAACVLIGVLLGRFLDSLMGTSPWLLLLFSLLGAGAAFKALFDLANKK
jgi:ATP synthase protein I